MFIYIPLAAAAKTKNASVLMMATTSAIVNRGDRS